jgi:hypothetical protein
LLFSGEFLDKTGAREKIMKSIQLRTEIPGPNSIALMRRREAAVPRGPYTPRRFLPRVQKVQ